MAYEKMSAWLNHKNMNMLTLDWFANLESMVLNRPLGLGMED